MTIDSLIRQSEMLRVFRKNGSCPSREEVSGQGYCLLSCYGSETNPVCKFLDWETRLMVGVRSYNICDYKGGLG